MDYGTTVTTDLSFDDAVARTREALQEQGFGVLTEIDVQATLKDKLDQDMEQYLILGACNPQLAHQALDVERDIGLLLPCNVVVRDTGNGTTLVQALDPQIMVTVPGRDELQPIAEEASRRLQAALDGLRGQPCRPPPLFPPPARCWRSSRFPASAGSCSSLKEGAVASGFHHS